jgi:hypothetical protein
LTSGFDRPSVSAKGKQSLSNFLRKAAHLSPVATGLLQEAAKHLAYRWRHCRQPVSAS